MGKPMLSVLASCLRLLQVLLLLLASARAAPLLLQRRDPLPDYVLKYAPLVFLSADEKWWPTDVTVFLNNTQPMVAGSEPASMVAASVAASSPASLSLPSLAALPMDTYLTSIDDVAADPAWLYSDEGKPDENGYSAAPAIVIIAPKANGVTDVFYYMFFAYNEGKGVLEATFGNHVGDWEYAMIRFTDAEPQTIYLSQHAKGTAYQYASMIQSEGRVTLYSAQGSHGLYPVPGKHIYDSILFDETDGGHQWNISQNYKSYFFDYTDGTFSLPDSMSNAAATASGSGASLSSGAGAWDSTPTAVDTAGSWLTFEGFWGDQKYSEDDPRQACLFGHCKYEVGPHGPYLKNLGRNNVCQDESECDVKDTVFD